VIIKNIPESDYMELYALRQCVLRYPLGLNLFNEDLQAETNWLKFGAYLKNRLVGCVMLTPLSASKLKLRQMCVYNYMQGQGVGSDLVSFAESYAFKNNFKLIELNARDLAIPFYEKLGYKKVGDVFLEVGIEHVKMFKRI
jgi:predicted GNAT family N-acyltransferase